MWRSYLLFHCFLSYKSIPWFVEWLNDDLPSFHHGLTWWLSLSTPSPNDCLGHSEHLSHPWREPRELSWGQILKCLLSFRNACHKLLTFPRKFSPKTFNGSYQWKGLAAKSLQSCPTLHNPIDGNPPGSPIPGILQARTLEWVAIDFSNTWKWKVKVKSFSHVQPSATPWTAAYQAPPSMGFSGQEYWSGVPLLSPERVLTRG